MQGSATRPDLVHECTDDAFGNRRRLRQGLLHIIDGSASPFRHQHKTVKQTCYCACVYVIYRRGEVDDNIVVVTLSCRQQFAHRGGAQYAGWRYQLVVGQLWKQPKAELVALLEFSEGKC